MKKIALLICCFITCRLNAQIGLGITTPHPNAYFEINSNNKGVLLPRMTSAERLAIAPTATAGGLVVYDTDLTSFMYWDGASWQTINSTNNGLWTTNGTAIYNTNTGNVGINNNNPISPLSFDGNLGDKISLWGTNLLQNYGFGVQSGVLQIHAATPLVDDIAFGTGATNNFYEAMRIRGNGNVGIGNTDAAFKLDVSGRMRIRSGGNIFTAGHWLNNEANSASPAFIGMESDNSVGFYGSGYGWGLTMNTNTGKVRIADGTQAVGRILSSDANGVASWVNSSAITPAVSATFPAAGGVNLTTAMGAAYTNLFIDLPPGKWNVIGTYLLAQGGSNLAAGQSMFVRLSFSSLSTANTNTGDLIGSGLMSGNIAFPTPFAIINGQNIVNNTSGATKRYYVWAYMVNTGGEPVGFYLNNFCGSFWSENNLVAIPMN